MPKLICLHRTKKNHNITEKDSRLCPRIKTDKVKVVNCVTTKETNLEGLKVQRSRIKKENKHGSSTIFVSVGEDLEREKHP